MIDFRYHVVSLFAVLVALGAGVVLGNGPLHERVQSTGQHQTDEVRTKSKTLRQQIAQLRQQAAVDDAFASEVAGPLTDSQLASRKVAVFALPGADRDLVAGTVHTLEQAGAQVTATVTLTGVYVDPAKAKSPLEDLVLRLVPPGVEFADGSTAIERVGTVLARATVTDDPAQVGQVDQPAAEVLAGLQELRAVRVAGEPGKLAELAVLVAPRETAPGAAGRRGKEARQGARTALIGLAGALDTGGRGAVVTGPAQAAQRGGFLSLVRDEANGLGGVSTIDLAERPVGQIALVLGLVEQMRGASGDYGAAEDADSVVPDLLGGSGS